MGDRATKRPRPEGITLRHGRGCPAREGGACACRPAYQAQVFSARDRRTIRKTFHSLSEARAWRADTKAALQKGTLRAPTRTTLTEAADDSLCASLRCRRPLADSGRSAALTWSATGDLPSDMLGPQPDAD